MIKVLREILQSALKLKCCLASKDKPSYSRPALSDAAPDNTTASRNSSFSSGPFSIGESALALLKPLLDPRQALAPQLSRQNPSVTCRRVCAPINLEKENPLLCGPLTCGSKKLQLLIHKATALLQWAFGGAPDVLFLCCKDSRGPKALRAAPNPLALDSGDHIAQHARVWVVES